MTDTDAPGGATDPLPEPDAATVVRRAPFASNPFVGARGQQAQARILDAALQVFGEVGYHECGVKRITELSGCSRASFYQYFSNKEDVFRHLAGKVARELRETTEAVGPITPDQAGHDALRSWLDGFSALYDTYTPVFVTFHTAMASDEAIASGSSKINSRTFTDLRARVQGAPLSSREIDRVIRAMLDSGFRANRTCHLLESVPGGPATRVSRAELNEASADVFHRALFGRDDAVNVHSRDRRRRRPSEPVPAPARAHPAPAALGPAARKTRSLLIETGHEVFAERGYYATRVADIAKAAEVSHGVFYRYFDNKAELFEILAQRAAERMSSALDDIPESLSRRGDDGAADDLRQWLHRYAGTYAEEAAIITMWRETMSRDPALAAVSAAAVERSAEPLARFLDRRAFGDADADALVMLVFLDAMTAQRATASRIETVAEVIERGLLDVPRALG